MTIGLVILSNETKGLCFIGVYLCPSVVNWILSCQVFSVSSVLSVVKQAVALSFDRLRKTSHTPFVILRSFSDEESGFWVAFCG